MGNWTTLREIVEESDVTIEVDKYTKKFDRFEEAYDALKWLLAHEGEAAAGKFEIIDDKKFYLYAQAADKVALTPKIVVLYMCDDKTVKIIGIDAYI